MPKAYPIARNLLFRLPAETAHELAIDTLAHTPAFARRVLRALYEVRDQSLRSTVFGIDFPNPVGLAAGLDKGAVAYDTLGALGFGFVEVGTVTALAQEGNPRPRLFRLPADQALLNRMGFNNPGAEAVAAAMRNAKPSTILGINIGKSKVTPLEDAVTDYLRSVELLARYARYLVVNVSSPNTPGLRELQDAGPLRDLLRAVVGAAGGVPVLVKLAPDLEDPQVDQAVEIAQETAAAGVVISNTTISRAGLRTPDAVLTEMGPGGISGVPVRQRAHELVGRVYRNTGGRLPIIGVGGIFNADDAWERIRAGASLIQVYTGFIYGGPGLIRQINRELAERVRRGGFRSIAEVVGTAHR